MSHARLFKNFANESHLFDKNKVTIHRAKLLGDGAYANIYRGSYRHLDELLPVAIKVINLTKQDEEECEKENAMMSALTKSNSPHTIELFGSFKLNSTEFALVISLAEKGALSDWLGVNDAQYLESQIDIMIGVIKALMHLHEFHRYLHCDVKPDNVLLEGEFHPKLTDFGLSKRIDEDDLYELAGSPRYMSPELLFEESGHSQYSDIYSFALLCWQILTGAENPYSDINKWNELVDAVGERGEREDLSDESIFPSEFANLIAWAWEQHAGDRPTARVLNQALERYKEEEKSRGMSLR